MEISIKNAEKIFREALKALNGEMPECAEECGFCGWGKSINSA